MPPERDGPMANEFIATDPKELALSSIIFGVDRTTEASHSYLLDELNDLFKDKFTPELDKKENSTSAITINPQLKVSSIPWESKGKKRTLHIDIPSSKTPRQESRQLESGVSIKTPIASPTLETSKASPRVILEKLKSNLRSVLDKGKTPKGEPPASHSARLMQAIRSSGDLRSIFKPKILSTQNSLQQSSPPITEKTANLEVLRKMNIHILDRYVRSDHTPLKEYPNPKLEKIEDSPRKKIVKEIEPSKSIWTSQTCHTSARRINGDLKRTDMRLSIGVADTRHSLNASKEKNSQLLSNSSTKKKLQTLMEPHFSNKQSSETLKEPKDTYNHIGKDSIDLQRLYQMKKKLTIITNKKKQSPARIAGKASYIVIDDVLQEETIQIQRKPATLGCIPQKIVENIHSPIKSQRNLQSPSSEAKQDSIKKAAISFWEKAAATKQKFGSK